MLEEKAVCSEKTKDFIEFMILAVVFVLGFGLGVLIWEDKFVRDRRDSSYQEGFNKGVRSVKPLAFSEQLKNVANEMRNNPQGMRDFLGEAVDIAIKSSPSFAIQVESYASEKTKKEMEQLRESADLKLLLRQKQEIEAFKAQISALQTEKDQIPNLHQQIARLKEESQSISKLNGQIDNLQKNNSALQEKILGLQKEGGGERNPFVEHQKRIEAQKKAQEELERKRLESKDEGKNRLRPVEVVKPEEVPVLLISNWDMDTPIFQITQKDVASSETFYYSLDVGNQKHSKVINLKPGKYIVEIKGAGWITGNKYDVVKKELTVTERPLINYGGNKWHGLVTTGK